VTIFCVLPVIDGSAQSLYGCHRPVGMPSIPNGADATTSEMVDAREAVDEFLTAGDDFIRCLSDYIDDPVTADIYGEVLDQMDLVAVRYNEALCTYSRGTQCVDAYREQRADTSVFPAARQADPQGNSLYEVIDPSDSSIEADPLRYRANDSIEFEEQGGSAVQSLESLQAESRNVADAFQVEEPTLPDGTPCGEVRQIRNETSGTGSYIRAHFAWEAFNDCFEPIRFRWTFTGDGYLQSERTIPARGSQTIGCSSRAGSVSSRRCTGGIEYVFEWQSAER